MNFYERVALYRFYVQTALSFTGLIICAIGLFAPIKGATRNAALFSSLATGIFAFWMPAPGSQPPAAPSYPPVRSTVAVQSKETMILANPEEKE